MLGIPKTKTKENLDYTLNLLSNCNRERERERERFKVSAKTSKTLTKNSGATVIRIVNEDVVTWFAIDHLPTPTYNSCLVTQQNCIQILRGNLLPSIILQP